MASGSSKRKTAKKAPDVRPESLLPTARHAYAVRRQLKEYHLPASASIKHFATRRAPESKQPAYADPQVPTHRQVSKAHSPLVSGTYTRTTSAAISRGQLVTVQQAFAARKVTSNTFGPELNKLPSRPMVSNKLIGIPQPVQDHHHHHPRVPVTNMTGDSTRTGDPDTRFRAFLARVGKGRDMGVGNAPDKRIRNQPVRAQATIKEASIASDYAPSIACGSLDDLDTTLDPDFLAEITKRHSLEEDLEKAITSSTHQDATEPLPGDPATPAASLKSSQLLSPDASVQVSSTRARPPPRPPRSALRVSASPVTTQQPRPEPRPLHETQSYIPVAFEDAEEQDAPAQLQAPFELPERPSQASTRQKQKRRTSLNGITTALVLRPQPVSLSTGVADVSHNLTANFEDIVTDLPDPVIENYERDRRLSSLLKGLGIQGLSIRPPSPILTEPIHYYPSSPSEAAEQHQILPEPPEVDSPEVTFDFTIPAASPIDVTELASADEGELDDWGSAYPDSPDRSLRATAPSHADTSLSPSRKSSTRRQRSASAGSFSRSRLRTNSQGGKRSRTASLYGGSPGTHSSADTRASLGITDSVLASILASDSFYLPNGTRLSVHELAARLSVDQAQLRRSLTSQLALPPQSPGPGSSVMTASSASRQSSMQYFRPLSTNGSRSSWQPETPATQYFEDSPVLPDALAIRGDAATEGSDYDYNNACRTDADLEEGGTTAWNEPKEPHSPGSFVKGMEDILQPPGPVDASSLASEAAAESQTAGHDHPLSMQPLFRTQDSRINLEEQNSIRDLRPTQPILCTKASQATLAPTSASKSIASDNRRMRTLSVNAFQKLSSTFSGTSRSGKARKRLPSFFGGGGSTPSLERGIESIANRAMSSDTVSLAPSSIRAPSPTSTQDTRVTQEVPPSSAIVHMGRPRAMTGPSRPPRPPSLHDIALAVTGSPSLSPLPPEPKRSRFIVHRPNVAASAVHLPLPTERTWRATIPENIYDQISRIHSADELLRQEVIFELCQTEESFVNGLKGVVKLFSEPLRTSQGKWIAGVPFNVSRLFDSLNDIVYLHSHLVEALRQNKLAQGALVLRFAGTFMPYVSRLEVHQAYLVRFEGVTREIEDLARKPDSEFGEFVRMQQGLPECGQMTLTSFLLKPVQRLMKYPLFFRVR